MKINDKVRFTFQGERYKGKVIKIGKNHLEIQLSPGVEMTIGKDWVIND